MKQLAQFAKTTIKSGFLYLIPIVVLLAVLGKAHQLAIKVTAPLANAIPWAPDGIRSPGLLAIVLILVFCFLAGLVAKGGVARRFMTRLESSVLSKIPMYSNIKSGSEILAGVERSRGQEAVLARIEDAWQVAIVMERLDAGHVAVFVPGAPNPTSGNVYFMNEDRVKPLDMPVKEVLACVQRLGVGSSAVLRGKV
jgi:uncharacterized membrane protein